MGSVKPSQEGGLILPLAPSSIALVTEELQSLTRPFSPSHLYERVHTLDHGEPWWGDLRHQKRRELEPTGGKVVLKKCEDVWIPLAAQRAQHDRPPLRTASRLHGFPPHIPHA